MNRKGRIWLILLLVLCLAGAILLGAEAWRIISERHGGAQWHEQELQYISEGTPVVPDDATEAPLVVLETPEPEVIEEQEPAVVIDLSGFVLKTSVPTLEPSAGPTEQGTAVPVATETPTAEPVQVTTEPTQAPTAAATTEPTKAPTTAATTEPTKAPTAAATTEPTQAPTAAATTEPTQAPTAAATTEPTQVPTVAATTEPTQAPTAAATTEPTQAPTAVATTEPTPAPTAAATIEPTTTPTAEPTVEPTVQLTTKPPLRVTSEPTRVPKTTPTPKPTVTPTQPPTPEPMPTQAPIEEPTPVPIVQTVGRSITSPIRYTMNFGQLAVINEDVRGWLIAEDTILNYPVVQAEDNEYYLTHLFSGEQNKTGAVFMDCGNSRFFTDMCTWLYAHNRQDDTMFAVIPSYADQAFFDSHPTMYLLTPYGDFLVELFACIRGNVTEAEKWHVKSFDGRSEFETYIQNIRSQSRVTSDTEVLWGDQLLAMSTCTNQVHEERYVLFGVLRPIIYEEEGEGTGVTQLELEARESYTKTVEIPGYGEAIYYAQNDPTWGTMRYEPRQSTTYRKFGASGCGPTALAMAIANLADDEQLSRLLVCPSSEYGFSLCTCSVNQYYCNRSHVQMRIQTLQDLSTYLPVVLGNFATGNNLWGIQSRSTTAGTTTSFFPYVANACSLDFTYSRDFAEMLTALQDGAVVVASTGGSGTPFTGGGHYVTVISMDEEYLYILDPYYKESYRDTDTRHVLEVLEPGVVRAKWSRASDLCLYGFYIIQQRPGYVPPESKAE